MTSAPFQNNLFELIRCLVINMPENEIISLYGNNFSQPDKLIQSKALLQLCGDIKDKGEMFGVDFPIWFGKYPDIGSATKKIMIIGIDPLRNKKDFNYDVESMKKDVIIGTPYALHSKKMREGKTRVYWDFIKKLLSEDNFIYLTDIYKSYHVREGLRSYKHFEKNPSERRHLELLEKEIGLIKPTHIITFGKIAENNLKNISNEKSIQVIPMLHPAARAKIWNGKIEKATVENKVRYMYGKVMGNSIG